MKRCAFLTMANMDAFECYDYLLYEPFANIGWDVVPVPWRDTSTNWNTFDVVIIRSPWDYQQEPDLFMEVLEAIDASSARLENSLDIVRWNIDKTYLKDMQDCNIPIVPTIWQNNIASNKLPATFEQLNTDQIIIKPVISANADDTFWLKKDIDDKTTNELRHIFSDRRLMIQPFMDNILTEGEFSLFYFAGSYSHAILKTPKTGDFRVQEEHGGRLKLIEPEEELMRITEKTMHALPETPLYARIDFVRTTANSFALMEIELIEPSLYFNMDEESPSRFARHFDDWMKNRN